MPRSSSVIRDCGLVMAVPFGGRVYLALLSVSHDQNASGQIYVTKNKPKAHVITRQLPHSDYPAHGPWRFTVHRIVGSDSEAVSDVSVTDGVQSARAISFFTVAVGKITRLVEYWPEPYAAPANRAHLVEPLE